MSKKPQRWVVLAIIAAAVLAASHAIGRLFK